MNSWIETIEVLGTDIPRTYQQGLDLGSAVAEKLQYGEVNLSFLNVKWLTVEFICGFNATVPDRHGISFHYMRDEVATMLGGSNGGIQNARRTVSGKGRIAPNTRDFSSRRSGQVDIAGG